MKLTEDQLQELAAQLRCPDGENGLKVGEMMNFTNSNIIHKTIESLNLKDNDSILEIGPGNGVHVKDIFDAINQVTYTGIDISATMVTEAQTLNAAFTDASFILTDGESVPFDDSNFTKIFTDNTIYFWSQPEAYAKEIARVLQPGGLVAIGFIPKSTMIKIPFAKYGFTLYDTETVTTLLTDAGLEIQNILAETEMVMSNSGEQIEREFVVLTAKKI